MNFKEHCNKMETRRVYERKQCWIIDVMGSDGEAVSYAPWWGLQEIGPEPRDPCCCSFDPRLGYKHSL